MTTDQFMLWRFRTTDGILDNIKSFNMQQTVFLDGSKFQYDYLNEVVTVFKKDPVFGIENKQNYFFREFTKSKIFSLGYKERSADTRHSSSYDNAIFTFSK